MKTYSKDELNKILGLHTIWTNGDSGGERANLKGADLSRTNLSGANLKGADLSRTNLSGACLNDSDLSGAKLRWVDLRRADLEGADLSGADLKWADLKGADLRWANLSGANLSRANLSGANLRRANLSGANLSVANLKGADLSRTDLRWANLSGADLEGADLSGADLEGANLEPIKKDFFKILSQAVNEISFLEKAILEGKIDGSTYEGECACLCGTIEKAGNKRVGRDYLRPIERFFLSIKKGDTPENNQFSKIAMEWLQEFKISIGESL